jgi:Ca-activated chloride channel family protein
MKYFHHTIKILLLLVIMHLSINSKAGGILVVSPAGTEFTAAQRFNPFCLTVKSLSIETVIINGVAQTTIKQVFHNPTKIRLQGYFLFPVPENSILRDFQMDINGKLTKAELLDAADARKLYEDIVRKTLDPALLEYANTDLFKMRVFPIEPDSDKTIIIKYNTLLTKDNLLSTYTLPLNTQKFSAQALNDITIHIKINGQNKIASVYSPTHQIEAIQKDEKTFEVGFEAKQIKPDADFKLYIQDAANEVNLSALAYKGADVNGFAMFSISPNFYVQKTEAKDYTFVVDVSGSMREGKIEQAIKAISYCVKNLDADDNFQIIRFSTTAEKFFPEMQKANKQNKEIALSKIAAWEAIGGTNMEAAFKLAFEEKPNKARKQVIVFLTDGKPTIGEIDEKKLLDLIAANNSEKLRIFTFGIGNDLNTHLLDKISAMTNAYRSYITEEEKIDDRIQSFFDKVRRPAISNLVLSFSGDVSVTDQMPNTLPDLFYGQNLVIVAKVDKEGKVNIGLKGDVNQKEVSLTKTLEIKFVPENEFIPFIWATRQVGALLDQIRLSGETKDLKDEIVHLAKKYGIITPYTSYLILEDETIAANTPINDFPVPYRKILSNDFEMNEVAEEYKDMQKKSGLISTRSSEEIQQLSNSSNVKDLKTGQSRMSKNTGAGVAAEQNANCYKNTQGRAFYKSENSWYDAQLNEVKAKTPERKIKFASNEYFQELTKHPELGYYFSLGTSCRFYYKGVIYQIEN